MYLVLTGLWFAVFILDCDQTRKGLEFCQNDFEVKVLGGGVRDVWCADLSQDKASGTTTTLIFTAYDIQSCNSGPFSGICFMDFLAFAMTAAGLYIMEK